MTQSIEPNQRYLRYAPFTVATQFHSTNTDFQRPNKFIVGFHWGNEASIAKAILANQNNVYAQYMNEYPKNTPDYRLFQDSALLMVEGIDTEHGYVYDVFTHAVLDTALLNTHSMAFRSNLLILLNDDQYDIISKRPNDESHPIFGFQTVRGIVPDTGSFLLLDNTVKDQVVCHNPWGSEYLHRTDYKKCKKINTFYQNGKLLSQKSKKKLCFYLFKQL